MMSLKCLLKSFHKVGKIIYKFLLQNKMIAFLPKVSLCYNSKKFKKLFITFLASLFFIKNF